MGSLLPVDIYIIVREDCTTYRRYTYSLVFHPHLLDDFGNELMHYTVTTAWAIVHVIVIHQRRLLADDILWLNYLISIHSLTSFSLKHQQFPRAQEQYHQDGRTAPQEWHHSQPDGHPVPSVLH